MKARCTALVIDTSTLPSCETIQRVLQPIFENPSSWSRHLQLSRYETIEGLELLLEDQHIHHRKEARMSAPAEQLMKWCFFILIFIGRLICEYDVCLLVTWSNVKWSEFNMNTKMGYLCLFYLQSKQASKIILFVCWSLMTWWLHASANDIPRFFLDDFTRLFAPASNKRLTHDSFKDFLSTFGTHEPKILWQFKAN